MLLSIRCENFRKHQDLTVHFTPGINAIRSANEAGKTTILEAVAYAFFGTKGLKEPIDDVVTYGLKATKLRVTLSFDHAHVDYTLTRSKSGAELKFGRETVTGQSEVTRFIENLFGVSASMASKLMIARQKDLGGALSGGAAEAGRMIEDLANIDLIELLINTIKEKLVSGNTSAAEARVEIAKARADACVVSDFADDLEEIRLAASARDLASAKLLELSNSLNNLDTEMASSILNDERRLSAALEQRAPSLLKLGEAVLVPLPVAPAPAELAAVRAKIEAQKGLAAAEKLHQELKAADVEVLWDQPMEALTAEAIKTEASIQMGQATYSKLESQHADVARGLSQVQHAAQVRLAQLEGKLVKEESCAFCGKDLKDIPEVTRINNPLTKEIAEVKQALETTKAGVMTELNVLGDLLSGCQDAIRNDKLYLSQLGAVAKRFQQLIPLYTRAEAFIQLDQSTVPPMWTWTGPTDKHQSFEQDLLTLEVAAGEAIRAAAARVEQQAQLKELIKLQKADQVALAALPIKDAVETAELALKLKPQVEAAEKDVQLAGKVVQCLQADLQTRQALQTQALKRQEQDKEELAKSEASLAEMQANNALVKKLFAARPKITDKLWSIVLASVTSYLSQVRGERSVITRAESTFKINGNPVTGLSGSAEDVLGLAIRLALTKLFLPNIDFLSLDEVAAACDDQRETAMLGLLSTAGFAQVILVTHSQLADAFADNIITI